MTDDSTAESVAPGTRVAHYEIIELIGEGGMGTVYRARDNNLGREVALKCPLAILLDNPDARLRFNREARAASRLQHPNIVTIFEVFSDDGYDWMAMEFVDGRSLTRYLSRHGPLPPRELLRHAEGLADALREAHDHQVIHRDIKPSNILLDRKGLARLTDFGLARFKERHDTHDGDSTQAMPITEIGRVVGTAAYMSPEQALGQEVDERTDIFSLGTVLYEMCTAQAAFADESRGRILDAILHREPRAIPMFNAAISAEIIRVVGKCLAKRADERYQSAGELLADLRAERRRFQSSDYASSHPSRAVAPRPRNRPLLIVIGVAVLAVAAIAGFSGFQQRRIPIPESKPRQLTAMPEWEADVAISPDGGLLAYSSNESGNADIWVMDLRGGNALQLTDDPATDRSPAWYPDGSAIVFHSQRENGTGIWKVPRLGGTPTMVVANADDPAVSPDGTRLAVSLEVDSGEPNIAVVDLFSPSQITALTDSHDGLWGHRSPAWSPDGEWICYNDFRDLWIVPAEGGETRRLTADSGGDKDPVWSPGGRYIYFSSRREDTRALWRVRTQGASPQRVTVGTGPEVQPSLSQDGSLLAYTTFVHNLDPVLVDLETGDVTRTRGSRTDWGARITPDNSGFVFVSDRVGSHSLWWQPLVEGDPSGSAVRLNDEIGESANPEISPDGRWVAYQQRLGREARIAVLPLPAGLPQAIVESPGFHIHPAWSPDGSEIAYLTDREVMWDLMIVSVATGLPVAPPRLIESGEQTMMWPQWSPDGGSIAYISATEESWDVWMVSTDGSSEPRQITKGAEALQITWIPDSAELFASGFWGEPEISIRRIDPQSGDFELLEWPIDFGHAAVYGIFDVSNDGTLALYTVEDMSGDLWVLEATKGAF